MIIIAILLVIISIVAYAIVTYNGLVTAKQQIRASIQEIGNQLKRQADLIPNLTESVKGYLQHEKEIFAKLAEARQAVASAVNEGSAEALEKANQSLQNALSPIRAVFESTPELQGQEVVKSLMNNLRDTADKVAYSRRLLIDLVADFNAKISTFPGILFARLFGFKKEAGFATPDEGEHLQAGAQDIKTPRVKLGKS